MSLGRVQGGQGSDVALPDCRVTLPGLGGGRWPRVGQLGRRHRQVLTPCSPLGQAGPVPGVWTKVESRSAQPAPGGHLALVWTRPGPHPLPGLPCSSLPLPDPAHQVSASATSPDNAEAKPQTSHASSARGQAEIWFTEIF